MNTSRLPCRLPLPARLRSLLVSLAGAASLMMPAGARADVYVIAHVDTPQRTMTEKQAIDLFMGRKRAYDNGDVAFVFDLPREHAVRLAFYRSLTGMTPAQINSYWSRLMFTGQTMPPQALLDERAMTDMVKRNPSALGYVGTEPTDKNVRVMFVLKDKTVGSKDPKWRPNA